MEGAGRDAARRPERTAHAVRGLTCGAMVAAVIGLVAAVILGAPLVSILLVGLLLLCPLLLWVPFRFERRSLDESIPERRSHA